MIGGKHIQRGTNRLFTYSAFHTETGPTLWIHAIIQEGASLLEQPTIELIYQPSHGSVADVVIARLVRYMNDTQFGEGKPPEKRIDWTDFGPWK
jgi:hypothetical protein